MGARGALYPSRACARARRRTALASTLLALLVLGASGGVGPARADERAAATPTARTPGARPAVAVASSLRAAWPALEAAWTKTLPDVGARPSFGASRTLARQILRGAPFELLLAADEASLDVLPAARVAPGSRRPYAGGRLVLVARGTPADATDPLDALETRLAGEPGFRLAMPNPGHAPYGLAARDVLAGAGLWPLAPTRLALGENAAQTLQFLLAGAVDAAFVPAALVADGTPPGTWVRPIDPALHAPLVHALVLVADASDDARALADWFVSAAARDALVAAGFDPPP